MKTRTAIFAAILSASAFATPALADDQGGRASIRTSDLDLASEAGRTELSKRYQQAARDMCGVSGEAAPTGRARYCYERAAKQVPAQVAAIISQNEGKGG